MTAEEPGTARVDDGGATELLRRLAPEASDAGHLVVTIYLDIDGRQYPRRSDLEAARDEVLREAKRQLDAFDGVETAAVDEALDRARRWLEDGIDRSHTRGIAVFTDSEQNFFETVTWSQPFRNASTVGPRPDLLQLAGAAARQRSMLILLVDHYHARLFRLDGAVLEPVADTIDDPPRRVDDAQGLGRGGGFQHQLDAAAERHLRRVRTMLQANLDGTDFDAVLLGGPEEVVNLFASQLPPAEAQLVAGRLSVPSGATDEEVRSGALAVADHLENERVDARDHALADAVGEDRGTLGWQGALTILNEHRAEALLIEADATIAGAECGQCGLLATDPGECPACGNELLAVDDVVPVAVAAAIAQGATVDEVPEGDLGEHRLGVIARYGPS